VLIVVYLAFMALAYWRYDIVMGSGVHVVTGEPHYEFGLFESSQNVVLAITLILAVIMAFSAKDALLRGWLILIALGSFVLLGEETSWGQHYFGWGTEGWFAEFNDQSETNLHNTPGGWFDQKPRMLLQLGMFLGGVVHPLLKLWRGRGIFNRPWWLAPTIVCLAPVVISLLAGAPKAIDKLAILPVQLQYYRASEMEECFIYAFFVIYLLSLRARLKARAAA